MTAFRLLSTLWNVLLTAVALVAYFVIGAIIISFLFGDCSGGTPPPWVPKKP